MANITKYRGRWVAQVRRKGIAPRGKSFDTKADAEKWARQLEAEVDRCGTLPDARVAASTTVAQIIKRYQQEITPLKRSAKSEHQRLNALLRRPIVYRTLTLLSVFGHSLRRVCAPSLDLTDFKPPRSGSDPRSP
ncbi:hypothetical protein [Hansschlegelia beijingensis]|uniref:Site-specific integrase n=1 Tax=Hansschlegelia beijingensis TaxID=1133344 RepID=A0A7W6D8C0_9HYPH|nr:hypothetical protein [Hansschlegelia beijingensis]MBB3974114.1 hypothetical protein [Hansschlegelia beijingensis]